MTYLSEDPTYLAGACLFVAAILFVVLRITQDGKYLVMALSASGLALLVFAVERIWVTDAERVEASVYALGTAVGESDIPAVLAMLSDDVQYVSGDNSMQALDTVNMIKRSLANTKFDFLRITRLRTNVGEQSRRATAEFHVITGGSFTTPYNELNFGSANSSWSLAFKEDGPNIWKVSRITPVYIPHGQSVIPPADASASRPASNSVPEYGNPRFTPIPGKGRRPRGR